MKKILLVPLLLLLINKVRGQTLTNLTIKMTEERRRAFVESSFNSKELFILQDSVSAVVRYLAGFAPNLIEIKGKDPQYFLNVEFHGNNDLNTGKNFILKQITDNLNISYHTFYKEIDVWSVKSNKTKELIPIVGIDDMMTIDFFLKYSKNEVFVFDETVDRQLLIPYDSFENSKMLKDFLTSTYHYIVEWKKLKVKFLLIDLTHVKQ